VSRFQGGTKKVAYTERYRCSRGKAQPLHARKARWAGALGAEAGRAAPMLMVHGTGWPEATEAGTPRQTRRPAERFAEKKVVCPVQVTVTVYWATPTIATIRMLGMQTHPTGELAGVRDLWCRRLAPELYEWLMRSFQVVHDLALV
jgi:hypothetical protein